MPKYDFEKGIIFKEIGTKSAQLTFLIATLCGSHLDQRSSLISKIGHKSATKADIGVVFLKKTYLLIEIYLFMTSSL